MAQNAPLSADDFLGPDPFEGMNAPPAQSMSADEFLGPDPTVNNSRDKNIYPGTPRWNSGDELANAMTFGLSTYARGLGSFAARPSNGLYPAIESEQANRARYFRDNPLLGTGIDIAGSIPNSVNLLKSMPNLMNALVNPNLGVRAGAGVLAGAGNAIANTPLSGGDLTTNALVGGALGGALPVAGAGARALLPKIDPEVLDLAQQMRKLGIYIRPSQIAMSKALRMADSFTTGSANESQMLQYNRALSNTIGADFERFTPQNFSNAGRNLGSKLDYYRNNFSIDASSRPVLDQRLGAITSSTKGLTGDTREAVLGAVKAISNAFSEGDGTISGKAYQDLTRFGGPLYLADTSPEAAQAGRSIRDALDDAMGSKMSVRERVDWEQSKDQYKNWLALEPLQKEAGTHGMIDPSRVHTQVKKFYPEYGKVDPYGIQTLARGGRYIAKPELTGDSKEVNYLPRWARHGALGLGAITEGALAVANQEAAAYAAAGATGLYAAKKGLGRVLKGNGTVGRWVDNLLMNPALVPPGGALSSQIPGVVTTEQTIRGKK